MPTTEAAKTLCAQVAPGKASAYWQNLAAASLMLFYALYVGWQLASHMMCTQVGADYCQYLNSGTVANMRGYAAIYAQPRLEQMPWITLLSAADRPTIPVFQWLYPPVFVLPFQLLARLDPALGFGIWTAGNVALLIFYSRSFLRRLALPAAPAWLIVLIFVSLPVFMDLWLGQMSLLLMLCIGESMIAVLQHKFLRSGLWLGGLLLKPQLLILVVLILLLQRAWRTIAGAATSSLVLVLLSGLLVGPAGLRQILLDWLAAATGQANVWVQGMMNWRMVGTHLAGWIGPWAGWGIAGAGILTTVSITVLAWRRQVAADSASFPVAATGVLAASSMVAWHSHIHMGVILIPALLYTFQTGLLPRRVLVLWVFAPALTFAAMVFVPETLMALGFLSSAAEPAIYFVLGAAELSANACLFLWAVRRSMLISRRASADRNRQFC
jgi:hypothetical protein